MKSTLFARCAKPSPAIRALCDHSAAEICFPSLVDINGTLVRFVFLLLKIRVSLLLSALPETLMHFTVARNAALHCCVTSRSCFCSDSYSLYLSGYFNVLSVINASCFLFVSGEFSSKEFHGPRELDTKNPRELDTTSTTYV